MPTAIGQTGLKVERPSKHGHFEALLLKSIRYLTSVTLDHFTLIPHTRKMSVKRG
jgi:hypothetical protein